MNPDRLPAARHKLPKLMACLTKKVVDQQREKLLFDVKVLTAQELDRHKHPYHECIIKELDDAGFVESSAYIAQLIVDNIDLKKRDEIGYIVDIREHNELLDELKAGLSRAEFSRDSGLPVEEAMSILQLALNFSTKGRGVLWLADQLFLAAIGVAENAHIDGGKQHAICQYAYAKFLLEKYPHAGTDEPYRILQNVRHVTLGKSWLSGADVGEPQQLVFVETVLLLHRILLQEARACRDSDCNKAERICKMAERRAKDANRDDKLAEAITETGKCLVASKDLNGCLRAFKNALNINIGNKSLEGMCEGYKNVALALQRLGDIDGAEKNLTIMGKLAMENNLTYYLGLALEALGELYLNDGRPAGATPHLQEAFECFMYGGAGNHVRACCDRDETDSSTGHYRRLLDELLTVSDTGSRRRMYRPSQLTDVVSISMQLGDVGNRVSRLPSAVSRASEARGVVAAPPAPPPPPPPPELFPFEANTSRFSCAVSSGQEKMADFFKTLDKAHTCMLMRVKMLDWKCNGTPFWLDQESDELVPCGCDEHGRTHLMIIRKMQEAKELQEMQTIRSQSTIDDEPVEIM